MKVMSIDVQIESTYLGKCCLLTIR